MSKNEILGLVQKYEQALKTGKSIYMDADEFEDLIDYYDSADNLDMAKSVLDLALSIHPENSNLILKRAKSMVLEGHYQDALEYMDIYFSEYDFDLYLLKIECYLQLKLKAEAVLLTKIVLDDEDMDQHIILSELGYLYAEADYFDEAITYLKRSIEYNPENIDALGELSYAYEMKDMFANAIDVNNKILDIDPYSYETWVNIGKLYSLQEEFVKAIDAFEFALTINNNDTSLLKLIAHCLSLTDRIDEAIQKFEECLQLNPKDISAYISISECYISIEKYNEALLYLNKGHNIAPNNIEFNVKKAIIYIQLEQFDEASEIIKKGLEIDENSIDLWIVSGELHYQKGEIDNAENYFEKALDSDQENEFLLDKLSNISITKEQYEKAADYLSNLVTLNLNYPNARNKLALVYFELGNKEDFEFCLNSFSDEELKNLLLLFFSEKQVESFGIDRDIFIARLQELQENRLLFKNLKY